MQAEEGLTTKRLQEPAHQATTELFESVEEAMLILTDELHRGLQRCRRDQIASNREKTSLRGHCSSCAHLEVLGMTSSIELRHDAERDVRAPENTSDAQEGCKAIADGLRRVGSSEAQY